MNLPCSHRIAEKTLDVPARVRLPEGDERAYRLLGRPIPQAISIRLIIDTGAKRSSLVPQVLNQLAPTSASRATVETGLGMRQTELYWVRLEFMAVTLAVHGAARSWASGMNSK